MPRSPAQIEASRRNGARSHGPTTPDGKARSSMNGLRHGLRAATDLVLPDEDPAALAELAAALLREHRPSSELEVHLTERLAATMWKLDRADRVEAELLATQPPEALTGEPGGAVRLDPAFALHQARLSGIRRHQGQLGREQSRILRELHRLRQRPLEAASEPRPTPVATEPRRAMAPSAASEPKLPANANIASEPKPPLTRQQRRYLERQARKAQRRAG